MDLKDLSDDQKCNLEKVPSQSFFKFNLIVNLAVNLKNTQFDRARCADQNRI
jgi:hypothetical protein